MINLTPKWISAAAACFLLSMQAPAHGEHAILSGWSLAEEELLDQMRGGFAVNDGLKISFGIERSISINGELLSSSTFAATDIGKLVSGQAAASIPAAMVELIQNGAGNQFQPGQLAPNTVATFIQNSLNDQTIRSVTVINAATNSLDFLKSFNLQSVLNDALVNAAAVR